MDGAVQSTAMALVAAVPVLVKVNAAAVDVIVLVKPAATADVNVPPSATYAVEVVDKLNKDNVPPSCTVAAW